MKLCKDCKHSVWPNPLAAMYGHTTYAIPMCGHPNARRSLVNGDLLDSCAGARDDAGHMKLAEPGCGREGARFEERPPQIVGAVVKMTREEMAKMYPPRKSWIARLFGG